MRAFGFLLIAAYVPWWPGAATAPRWILLSLVVPAVTAYGALSGQIQAKTGSFLFGLFLFWAAFSALWTPDKYEFTFILWQYSLLFGLILIGSAYDSLENLFVGLGYGMILNLVITLVQYPGNYPFLAVTDVAGLFINKNLSAEISALVLVGLVAYHRWVLALAPAAIVGIIHARAPLIALGVVGMCWLWSRSRTAACTAATGLACVLLLFLTSGHHGDSATDRLRLWADTWNAATFWGRGTGSFYMLFPQYLTGLSPLSVRFDHPHADWLQILFENGWPGLVVFAVFLLFTLRGAGRPETWVLTAFLVEGAFGFPLYLPATQAVFALAAGCLVGARGCLRDDCHDFRDRVLAWADTGRRAVGRSEAS